MQQGAIFHSRLCSARRATKLKGGHRICFRSRTSEQCFTLRQQETEEFPYILQNWPGHKWTLPSWMGPDDLMLPMKHEEGMAKGCSEQQETFQSQECTLRVHPSSGQRFALSCCMDRERVNAASHRLTKEHQSLTNRAVASTTPPAAALAPRDTNT